jgi:HK97 family phage prohead protease
MPIPKPNKGESHKDFDERCMGDDTMVKEYPDEKERYAICQSQWETDKKADYPDDIESRIMVPETAEMRVSEDETPKLVGYAAKYGVQTDLGWFKEKIQTGAFDEALEKSDCRALKNHDPNLLLGREKSGTLRLKANSIGLHFEIDVPDTTVGRDTLTEVKRGDLQGCSFRFTVSEDKWVNQKDGSQERTITRIGELFDVGPVTYPAYPDTTVAARHYRAAFSRSVSDSPSVSPSENYTETSSKEKPPAQEPEKPKEISRERQRQIKYDYEEMGRIIRCCQSSKD